MQTASLSSTAVVNSDSLLDDSGEVVVPTWRRIALSLIASFCLGGIGFAACVFASGGGQLPSIFADSTEVVDAQHQGAISRASPGTIVSLADAAAKGVDHSKWECYRWNKHDEAEIAKNAPERQVCEKLRGDGYVYNYTHGHNKRLHGCGQCWCCRLWEDEVRQPEDIPNPYAFVMMAYNSLSKSDDNLWGALALANALRKFSHYPLVLLTNTTKFEDGTLVKKAFSKLGARIVPCLKVELPSKQGWKREKWNIAFWKLQVWQLTSFTKLVWLDTDAHLFRGIDWLFARDWMWAQRDAWFCELTAEHVCSGIMLLFPNDQDFHGLVNYSSEVGAQLTGGDQQLIEWYFRNVRKKPLHLLSPLEASFGQCAGTANSTFLLKGSGEVEGVWNVPAFIHKSGGWDNTVDNAYNNVCFTHDLARQRYYIGKVAINACHDNPLASHWRGTFCEALEITSVREPSTVAFCDDHCYYNGEAKGDKRCPWTSVITKGPVQSDPEDGDYVLRKQGFPAPEYLKLAASYKFWWGQSWGDVDRTIDFKNAILPQPPFTIVGRIKSKDHSACQIMAAWFGKGGVAVELRLTWGNIIYGEKNGGVWMQVQSSDLDLADGAWHTVAVVRSKSGETAIYLPGDIRVASGTVPAELPPGLGNDARSSRKSDCALMGEVGDLRIYDLELSREAIAEVM